MNSNYVFFSYFGGFFLTLEFFSYFGGFFFLLWSFELLVFLFSGIRRKEVGEGEGERERERGGSNYKGQGKSR